MTEPARFVGRRREISVMHAALTTAPSALVLQGAPGIGKTMLAEHYALLFRQEFTGGVIRLGPFGHHPPEEFLSQFHLSLAGALTARLGIDVAGITLGRLLGLCAWNGEPLMLIDDVPAELPPSVLERLLSPSGAVATLITTRARHADWAATTIDLPGLTEHEGVQVVGAGDRPAVRGLVRRCGGHPFALRAIGSALGRSAGSPDDRLLADQPETAPQAIRALLDGLHPLARQLLRLCTVLAPVPFPPELAIKALGSPDETEFAQAVHELVSLDFMSGVDGGLRPQALVRAVASALFEPGELAARAAEALLGLPPGHDFLLQHARVVAEHAPAHRARLLRPVAAAYERLGDWYTAGETHALILATGDAVATDLIAAARAELGCGLYAEAAGHARGALALAGDEQDRISAALTLAQALDCQGDYPAADQAFWREYADWLPPEGPDRLSFLVAAARARRLRGHPAEAAALVEPALKKQPADDLTQSTKLEYATSSLAAGRPERARKIAAEVIAAYRAQRRDRHSLCVEAELVRADATFTLDLRNGRDPRALEASYKNRHGPDAPLTLTARVMADHALLRQGDPGRALHVLRETEQTLLRVFGDEHRLYHRAVYGMAAAYGQLGDFCHQADLLDTILEPQISLLGRSHPETLATYHDLGVALMCCGRPRHQVASAGSQRTP